MDDEKKATESIVVSPTDLPGRARARSTPGKITDDVLSRICERIEGGSPISHACVLEGVSDRALRFLMDAHEDVYIAVRRAVARKVAGRLDQFDELVVSDPQAAKALTWLIERMDPGEFAPPKQRVEQTGEDGGPIKTESAVRWYVPRNPRIPTGEDE